MPDRPDDHMRRADEYLTEAEELLRETGGGAPLACVECAVTSEDGARGWRALLTVDDEVATYCPDCAEAEFDG